MRKRAAAILLVLCMALTLLPTAAFATEEAIFKNAGFSDTSISFPFGLKKMGGAQSVPLSGFLRGAKFPDFPEVELAGAQQGYRVDSHEILGDPEVRKSGFGKQPPELGHLDVESGQKHERFPLRSVEIGRAHV